MEISSLPITSYAGQQALAEIGINPPGVAITVTEIPLMTDESREKLHQLGRDSEDAEIRDLFINGRLPSAQIDSVETGFAPPQSNI